MKVVKVLWVDSCNSNLNWTVAEDVEVEPMYIDSFGVVIKDTDEFLAIAQNYGDNPEQYSNITTIPKGCIKEVFVIHEDNVCENEQKPTDKIEPKFNFKINQWIVATGKCVYLIAKIDGFNVTLVDTNGDEYVFDTSSLNDAHEWTIQDAKDGDVLCYKDEISLYKHYIKNCTKQETTFGGFVYHCCYDGKRFITDSLYSLTEQDKIDIHPATKEQRDLLFQKMKDDGYEWDTEKKELKKIHVIDEGKAEMDYCFTKMMNGEKASSTWSEEDEEIIECLNNCLDELEKENGWRFVYVNNKNMELNKIRNWLKSLKDSVQLKQEWSEEDEKMFSELSSSLLINISDQWAKYGKWLKSLKGRITWKPTEAQLASLTIACDRNDRVGFDLTQLLKELKKL